MKFEDIQICMNCRFWQPKDPDKAAMAEGDEEPMVPGECRRNTPKFIDPETLQIAFPNSREDKESFLDGYFPQIWGDEWCGEFEKKEIPSEDL